MSFLLRWLILPLLLLSLGLTVLLALSHVQVRSVNPELPTLEDIIAVTDQGRGPVDVAVITTATQTGPLGHLGHAAIVLTWADGRRFLIDTGMPPEDAVQFGKPMEVLLEAEPTITFGSTATQLGGALDSVRGIGFTHLHSDHTDGLVELCAQQDKPAMIFQKALQREEINHTTSPGDDAIRESDCRRRKLGDDTVARVRGFPGLAAVSLGGHTPGSTLFAVRSDDRLWLFAGDITNDKRSLDENAPKPWAYTWLLVPENTARTALLREWLADLDRHDDVTVLPAHDVVAMAEAGLPGWEL